MLAGSTSKWSVGSKPGSQEETAAMDGPTTTTTTTTTSPMRLRRLASEAGGLRGTLSEHTSDIELSYPTGCLFRAMLYQAFNNITKGAQPPPSAVVNKQELIKTLQTAPEVQQLLPPASSRQEITSQVRAVVIF